MTSIAMYFVRPQRLLEPPEGLRGCPDSWMNPDLNSVGSSTSSTPCRPHSQLSLASASRRRRRRNVIYSLSFLAEILEEFHTFSQTLLFVVFCDEVNMRKVCEEDKMRAHTGASMRRRTGKSGGRAGERDSKGFVSTKIEMYQILTRNGTIKSKIKEFAMINNKETHIFSILNDVKVSALKTWQIITKGEGSANTRHPGFSLIRVTNTLCNPSNFHFITTPLAMCNDGRTFQVLNYYLALHNWLRTNNM